MLTQKQQSKLKKLLLTQKNEILDAASDSQRLSLRDATDELSTLDNHHADLATELYEREKDFALQQHAEERLAKIEQALQQLEQGQYGICQTCKEPILYERLLAVPHTLFCTEHAIVTTATPDDAESLAPSANRSIATPVIQDAEDSLDTVTRYGNSDTPSDLDGDLETYSDEQATEDIYAAIDELHISLHESLTSPISQKYIEDARKNDYLD